MEKLAQLKFTPVLHRIAAEIRFRPTLSSWSCAIKAAQELESSYEHWKIKKGEHSDIVLYSPESKSSMRVKFDSMVYSSESATDTKELKKHFESTFKHLVKESGVNEFRHVGFRKAAVFKSDLKLEELKDLIYERFFKKEIDSNLGQNKIKDLMLVLDGEMNGKENHVRLGPADAKQAFELFNSPFEEVPELSPEHAYLFIDFDIYQRSSLKLKNVMDSLDGCINTSSDLIDIYIGNLEI